MAVFPDRIVLKNSTDARAAIETAIQAGGTDEIQQGELVIGRESGAAKLYTLDSDGSIAVVGGGSEELNDLTDVQTRTASTAAFYTGFEIDDIMPTYSGGASRSSTVTAVEGTYFLAEGSSSYADFYFDDAFVRTDNRYDLYSMWIQPRQTPSTNYRMALGGLAQMYTGSGAGFAIYTRDTGFGIFADNAFTEVGTRPSMASDTWHHFAVQIDWGTGNTDRVNPPDFISIWVNGSIALDSYAWNLAYTAPTGAALKRWAFLDSTGTGWSKFYDEMRIAQTDDPLIGMSQSSFVIANLETAIDSSLPGDGPTDGQILVYDASQQLWIPGAGGGTATLGRGDGGDLDTGTIGSAFVFGVYGGGDLDALNATAVAPFAHGRIDVNNITGGTLAGMTAAAHVYSSGVNSYIDFTFATAQPNADYDVVVTWEIGPELHEVQSKTVNGFRVDFYDMGTGNYMSSGAVAISQPVVSVYASDPTIGINSDAGVDYPVEFLGDGGAPDGGDIT